ncbi:NAPRTase domain-containing protein [Balamuthia mandrillaris]
MASSFVPLHNIIPLAICSDSYKAGHFTMYPEANRMVAYGEFRKGFNGDKEDVRFVFCGMRYLVETFLNRRWTLEDVDKAERFYATHNAGRTPYPWPADLFRKFIKENDGYFPVRLQALPEGTCAHVHVPVYQISAEKEYSRLVTFLETLLTQVWYPCTVATLSRRVKTLVEAAFERSVDEEGYWQLPYKLHDFGFRGCTTLEQSVLGGLAHLLSFAGTDTMSAAYYAQFELNGGKPVAESVPATEHSVMTSWRTEREAIENMIDHHGAGVYSIVLDSYDYVNCLDNILPTVAERKAAKGGVFVLRPDSGDPVEAVLMGLRAGEKAFGATINKKGYKVLNQASVLQGDGIGYPEIKTILDTIMDAGYSAQSVVFGMGAGLLQKVNRDTLSFATKLSYIEYADGTKRDVMKYPKTDSEKISLPGELKVKRDPATGIPTIYPATRDDAVEDKENLLKVVYDHGPVKDAFADVDFDGLKERVQKEWSALPAKHDPVSEELRGKIDAWVADMKQKLAAMQSN